MEYPLKKKHNGSVINLQVGKHFIKSKDNQCETCYDQYQGYQMSGS